jgi:hypothetical protein
LVEELWPHILLEVMVVMSHHSHHFAMLGGLTLLMCGLHPPFTLSEAQHHLFGKKGQGA